MSFIILAGFFLFVGMAIVRSADKALALEKQAEELHQHVQKHKTK